MRAACLAVVLVLVSACVPANLEEARQGLPQAKHVTVPLPGDSSVQGGEASQPLLGQVADMYLATRAVTVGVNGGVVWVLGLVHGIARLPPTSSSGDTFVWGPSQPKGLEPKNNYKLEIKRNDDGSWSYTFFGKKTDEADSAFRSLISGTHVKETAARAASGTLLLDFDAAQQLNNPGKDVGRAEVTYGYQQGAGYQVVVDFQQVRDGNSGRRIDAKYRYREAAAGAGSFEFSTAKDADGAGAEENLLVRSRWMNDGRGRSDIKASGGSLAAPATFTECWDNNFKRTYATHSWAPAKTEGEETACAFLSPDYAVL